MKGGVERVGILSMLLGMLPEAVAIMFFVIWAMYLLDDEVQPLLSGAKPLEKLRAYFSELGAECWAKAAIVGVGVSFINWLAAAMAKAEPMLPGWIMPLQIPLAIVMYVAMLATFVALVRWWHAEGFYFKEMIPFFCLIGLFLLTAEAAAWATVAVFGFAKDGVLAAILTWVPGAAAFVAIVFMPLDRWYFNRQLDE